MEKIEFDVYNYEFDKVTREIKKSIKRFDEIDINLINKYNFLYIKLTNQE